MLLTVTSSNSRPQNELLPPDYDVGIVHNPLEVESLHRLTRKARVHLTCEVCVGDHGHCVVCMDIWVEKAARDLQGMLGRVWVWKRIQGDRGAEGGLMQTEGTHVQSLLSSPFLPLIPPPGTLFGSEHEYLSPNFLLPKSRGPFPLFEPLLSSWGASTVISSQQSGARQRVLPLLCRVRAIVGPNRPLVWKRSVPTYH